MEQKRDVLQSLGDLASIGNYFKLRNIEDNLSNIENTINSQNRNNTEQNNLRNIVYNFKNFLDGTFLQLNDYIVKSFEILRIIEYLGYYNITADSFNSFSDKEYFTHFYQKLKGMEIELRIDENKKANLTKINKLFSDYETIKYNLQVIKYCKEENEIIFGKRYLYALIISLLLFFILNSINISYQPGLFKILLFLPWVYAFTKNSHSDSQIIKKSSQFIKELGIDGKYPNLDVIIPLLERNKIDYSNMIKQTFIEHKEFSITHPNLFNEIESK